MMQSSVILLFLIGVIAIGITGEEERNIFFNKNDYEAEKNDAKESLQKAALSICPNHTREVEIKLEEARECSWEIDENNNTMCQVIKQNLDKCFTKLFKYYESCVPEQAKGLPTYTLDTLRRITEYVCNADGAHFLELGNPCILKKDHVESRFCIRKFKKEAQKYHFENLPEKEQLCIFLEDFRSCFDNHVDRQCHDKTTQEAYKGLYKMVMCKK